MKSIKGLMSLATMACGLSVIMGDWAVAGDPKPIDFGAWKAVQYEFNVQPDARWTRSNANTVVTQTVSSDASIFLSDFRQRGAAIDGVMRVSSAAGDDFVGFVFGYQGRGKYYLFDWRQANQSTTFGFAQQGMSLKTVHAPPKTKLTGFDLWPTASGPNATLLRHNTAPWADFTDYSLHLEFLPGRFTIEVRQGQDLLESWAVEDDTYRFGKFGFYNYAQNSVIYSGFTITPIPEPTAGLSLAALGTGLLIRRRPRK